MLMTRSSHLCSPSHLVLTKLPQKFLSFHFTEEKLDFRQFAWCHADRKLYHLELKTRIFCSKSTLLTNVNRYLEPAPHYSSLGKVGQDRGIVFRGFNLRFLPVIPQGTPTLVIGKSKVRKSQAKRGEELNQTVEWVLQHCPSPLGAVALEMSFDKRTYSRMCSWRAWSFPHFTQRKWGHFCTWRAIRDHLPLTVCHASTLEKCESPWVTVTLAPSHLYRDFQRIFKSSLGSERQGGMHKGSTFLLQRTSSSFWSGP